MVLELFDSESVLISDIKFGRKFKVNGHRLKPYLALEPPAPANTINLRLSEIQEDVTAVSSTLFICIFAFNRVIPLEIVSFYFLQSPRTLHPKDMNPFVLALLIGGRRVEGNSNTLSSIF